jgi:tetratricopeptide (TPR) repeat protein
MDKPAENTSSALIGTRIRDLRQQKGLTEEDLAGTEFTTGYVRAVERSLLRPSVKALEVLARRLGVPITGFVAAPHQPLQSLYKLQSDEPYIEPDPEALQAVQEDLVYQANYAKMLMRTGQVKEALDLVTDFETSAAPYHSSLPSKVTYLAPFLRGRAYLQMLAPELARSELEAALEIAGAEPEVCARVRNLLGVAFFELSKPHLALEQHKLCLDSIKANEINDLNFKVSVYGNLANDYWALNDPRLVIAIYKEVLPVLQDLNDLQHEAHVYWGIASAYNMSQDRATARLYAIKALQIYEACDNRAEAASICLSLAETLINDQRFDQAAGMLERADHLLSGTGNQAITSCLHRDYADLARLQGQHLDASEHARRSVELARAYYEATRWGQGQSGDSFWQDPTRVYAQALQMEGLVEECRGNREAADHLFEEALALIGPVGFEETKYAVNLSYAHLSLNCRRVERIQVSSRYDRELDDHHRAGG